MIQVEKLPFCQLLTPYDPFTSYLSECYDVGSDGHSSKPFIIIYINTTG